MPHKNSILPKDSSSIIRNGKHILPKRNGRRKSNIQGADWLLLTFLVLIIITLVMVLSI